MKFLLSLLVLALAVHQAFCEEEDPGVSLRGVKDLTEDNIDKFIGKETPVFIEFYAPWCGHCKSLVPEMKRLGMAAERSNGGIIIAKADASGPSGRWRELGVQGFPTIKFYPALQTEGEKYEGARTAKQMANFITKKTGVAMHVVADPSFVVEYNADGLEKALERNDKHIFVEFYAPWCGYCKSIAPVYEKVGEIFKNDKSVVIAKLDASDQMNKEAAEKYGIEAYPTLKFFPKGNSDPPLEYNEEKTTELFVAFINKHAGTQRTAEGLLLPSVGVDSDLSALLRKFIQSSEDYRQDVMHEIEDSAKKVEHGKYYIAVAQNIKKKGADYVKNESERLGKIMSGSVSDQAKDRANLRLNILLDIQKNN